MTYEDRKRCSEGWEKCLGFRLSPEKLRLCDGCQAPDDEKPVRYQNCYVRKCAVKNGMETCAHCSAYPCEDVGRVSLPADYREKRAARLGSAISEEDYLRFIEPYEGMKHLELIRASLDAGDIAEVTRVSARPRVSAFPDDLRLSKDEREAFRALHRILIGIESAGNVSYARQAKLKVRRRHLLKILWAFGLFGKREEEGGPHLRMEGETYLAQKVHSSYPKLKGYLAALDKHGVKCEHVPLEKQGWLTPGGALRRQGWCLKMSFHDDAAGVFALDALRRYVAKLNAKYGQSAFGYFSRADMQVLANT